jgi:hypothetical protein
VLVVALALTGAAVAAFILYTGVNGSGSGTFDPTTQATPAVTLTGQTQPQLGPDTSALMTVSATNNANHAVTLTSVTGAFTSSPPECASHLSVSGASGLGGSYAVGEVRSGTVTIALDGAAPSSCAGGSWSVAFGGAAS